MQNLWGSRLMIVREESFIDTIAKSLFGFFLRIIVLCIALQALISLVGQYLPYLIAFGIVAVAFSTLVTVLRYWPRYPRSPLIPPNTPPLSGHKSKRSRSTGGQI